MNIVQVLLHAIEEHDQVKLLTGLGHDVFNFNDPTQPFADMRPGIPGAPVHRDLLEACERKRREHAELGHTSIMTPDGPRDPIDWAKADLPNEVIDWMDVLIVHHAEHTFIPAQWPRLRDKRVIWRTVGQSVAHNEAMMAPLHADGMQIVRYSPKERNIPGYAGEDALIRFYKDPDEWHGLTGETPAVLNITQRLAQRDPHTNYRFWQLAVGGSMLSTAAGPGSEDTGGTGPLSYDEMRAALRSHRAYLYTGTQPASYTLGLLEALMTGIPVVSVGPQWMTDFPYGPDLFEGHELSPRWSNDPRVARAYLLELLGDHDLARDVSETQRGWAIERFGMDKIGAQWKAFLGA